MIELRSILLPTDFSEPALTATKYAVSLARQFGATLHLLHVIEDPIIYLPMFESYPLPTPKQFETYAEDRLENWIVEEERGDLELGYHWVHGRPSTEIVRFAARNNTDLVVLGTHGRGLATHVLMGSVAEKVVRKAQCAVLTVRPEGHQFIHPAAKDRPTRAS
jgi:nucleotide-binding universal stress UspA family protein